MPPRAGLTLQEELLQTLCDSRGAALTVGLTGDVKELGGGVASELVGTMVELDGLSQCLCARLEPRIGKRVRRSCEIQEGRASRAVGVPTLAILGAPVGTALRDRKTG